MLFSKEHAMFATQKNPELSLSYEEADADTQSPAQTLAPSHFSSNRLKVICSRGHKQATVKNMDMVKESAPPRKTGLRIFLA